MTIMYEHFKSGVPLMARAIVAANQDPDQLGRVRVTYPWLGAVNSEVPSNWAYVCQPYASKEGGTFFLPEKGDQVVVFFEGGNLDSPIIIGTLYSAKTKPQASGRTGDFNAAGKNNLRYIKTRSGHLLCFDESDDEGGIVIQDKDKRRFEIQSKKKKVIISDENGNQIELDGQKIGIQAKSSKVQLDDQKISIQADGSMVEVTGSVIKAQSKKTSIELNGTHVEISAGSDQVTIGGGGITIKSASSIKLGSGASDALLKGTTFLSLFNAHMHPTAMGPSGPPMIPLNPSVLSMKVKTE
jgi:uncharacterized protein involved in type VI secretion and phage assembly